MYQNKNHNKNLLINETRAGCKDIWNAFMVEGATFSNHDIPYCPTFLPNGLPKNLISYEKAKQLYRKEKNNSHFFYDAFIHFCIDDQKFDSNKSGIWTHPHDFLKLVRHFAGIITPDFSTYTDFPDPIKRYNTYRMRAFGYWCYMQGIPTINNVRWGTSETWEYCFDGLPAHSVIFIGTVASGFKQEKYKEIFTEGFKQLSKVIYPKTCIIYGSHNLPVLSISELHKKDINLLTFESETCQFFKGR